MSFLDEWNLSYPVGDDALDPDALSVRGRTTSGAGQFELAGAGYASDGTQIKARDIVDHYITFEIKLRNTMRAIRLSERYPVREVGDKVRINVRDSTGIRPNIGNLFAALFLLPDVSQIGKAQPLQQRGFVDKTYWIDAVSVSVADSDASAYILNPTRFVFATSNKDDPGQFSGATAFDFDERLSALASICSKGMQIAAGGVPAALKYYSDVLEARTTFSYAIGATMRKIITDFLETTDEITYQVGEDPLVALQQLVSIRPQESALPLLELKCGATIPEPHNLIFFGAPGTGKSFQLVRLAEKYFDQGNVRRVTFHPDYTYAQFVGCYKPTETEQKKKDNKGDEYVEKVIAYDYVPGPFLETYVAAVQNTDRNYLLIVEEINRANPAAAFGDIFQLLDRDDDGRSEYEIAAPQEMRRYLEVRIPEYNSNATAESPLRYISEEIRLDAETVRLSLPPNMYIWATMNSADQGVFPMDTAFKRRWDFRYMGINDGSTKLDGITVPVGEPARMVSWDALRRGINKVLLDAGVNEDKLLGPFFISPSRLRDTAHFTQTFMDKVLLYLFEDAAKTKKSKVFSIEGNPTYSDICDDFKARGELAFKGMKELASIDDGNDVEPEEFDNIGNEA